MRICIIMGAGSTLANAMHFRSRRQKDTWPPLDYTFFDKIDERHILVPTALREYARQLPSGSPFERESDRGRMEEFLRDLFYDFLQERSTATSLPVQAYRALVEIYSQVLRETTDWMRGDSYRSGPVGRLIADAARRAERVDIVTFNHDLLIENEIFRRARLNQRWCIARSYGAFSEGRTLVQTTGQPRFPDHTHDCDHDHPLVIHKMHGSLNWYVRIRASEPTPGVLAGEVSSPDVMIAVDRAVRQMRRVRMRPTGTGRQRWYVWPVIVPPIYSKHSLIQSFMPSVWADARTALSTSDRNRFLPLLAAPGRHRGREAGWPAPR